MSFDLVALLGLGTSRSISITLITSTSGQQPVFWDQRVGSNTQLDFIAFLVTACERRFLKRGDVLVMDNAAVHVASAHHDLFVSLMQAVGFRVITLPTYSPELNPCHLVFGHVKNFLSSDAAPHLASLPLPRRIEVALGTIKFDLITSWYNKCRNPKQI